MRKTNKYFRDSLANAKNLSFADLKNLIIEVMKKYVDPKVGRVYLRPPYNWNHMLEAFSYSKEYGLNVYVYWQGDSTDGTEIVSFDDLFRGTANGREYVIRAEHEFIGNRTYERHGDLRIEREEIYNLCIELAKYIEPSAIKARELRKKVNELDIKFGNVVKNENYKFYGMNHSSYYRSSSSTEKYYNGSSALDELFKTKGAELVELHGRVGDENFLATIRKVFGRNAKTNNEVNGKYDLSLEV